MSKRNSKRSALRKEQSERDRMSYVTECSYYGQMAAFHHVIGLAKNHGMYCDYIPIPVELIDLTAAFIASLVGGHDFLLGMPASLTATGKDAIEAFQSNAKFISRTLSRAKISCSSLMLGLWYIDQFFHRQRRRPRYPLERAHQRQSSSSHDSTGCDGKRRKRRHNAAASDIWHAREIFVASVIVADKYLADVTWTNADWADHTGNIFTCNDINALERRFLKEMNYQVYVNEQDYRDFCDYLQFRLHLQQLGRQSLSYHDVHVLSQSLPPVYVSRLRLSLRPVEAMILLAKTVTSICFMYALTFVAAYVLYQHIRAVIWQRHLQEHVVVMMIEMIKISGGVRALESRLLAPGLLLNRNNQNHYH